MPAPLGRELLAELCQQLGPYVFGQLRAPAGGTGQGGTTAGWGKQQAASGKEGKRQAAGVEMGACRLSLHATRPH